MKLSSDQIEHCLFLIILHRSSRAQKAHVLFAGVDLFLSMVVEVAVLFVTYGTNNGKPYFT